MNKNLDGQIYVSGTFFVVSTLALALIISKHYSQPSNFIYLLTFILATIATHSLIYYIQKVIELKRQLSKKS